MLAYWLRLPVAAYAFTPARMGSLAAGALLALAARGDGGLERYRRLAFALCGGAILGLAAIGLHSRTFYPSSPFVVTFSPTCLAVGFAAALLLTAPQGSRAVRLFSRGPLPFMGRYSYGLYVLHYPLFYWLRGLGLSPRLFPAPFGSVLPGIALVGLIAGAASLACALVSRHVLERPFLKLKDRVARKPQAAGALSR